MFLSSLCFLEVKKMRSALDSHLELIMGLCSQGQFNFVTFPYDEVFDSWMGGVKFERYKN